MVQTKHTDMYSCFEYVVPAAGASLEGSGNFRRKDLVKELGKSSFWSLVLDSFLPLTLISVHLDVGGHFPMTLPK